MEKQKNKNRGHKYKTNNKMFDLNPNISVITLLMAYETKNKEIGQINAEK